eukprot:68221_1
MELTQIAPNTTSVEIREEEKDLSWSTNCELGHQLSNNSVIMESQREFKHNESTNTEAHTETIDDFMKPLVDDYIKCKYEDTIDCRAAKRMLHILQYYNDIKTTNSDEKSMLIHDYLLTFVNYSISLLMEDWYHCKKMHLNDETDIEEFISYLDTNCVNHHQCNMLRRHQRDRGRMAFNMRNDIDHKNTILMDQLDTIHSYIFHSSINQSNENILHKYFLSKSHVYNSESDENESDHDEIKRDIQLENVWTSQPDSITECNTVQIVFIINQTDTINTLSKLKVRKYEIMEYIKENELDGAKISKMKRKTFISEFVNYFDDKKLSMQLGKLYNKIIKYDITKFVKNKHDIWANEPQCITDCNMDQIMCILGNDIFDSLHKLKQHKSQIICYFTENKFDGNKLIGLQRKPFINLISQHLEDKKT